MAALRGWALSPTTGTGTDTDPFRPACVDGSRTAGDRTEHIVGPSWSLVALDVADDGQLPGATKLCDQAELATNWSATAQLRRTLWATLAAEKGVDLTGVATVGAMVRRYGQALNPNFREDRHLTQGAAPRPGSFVEDTFTDTDGTVLSSHTGEVGATWTQHGSSIGISEISSENRLISPGSDSIYYASGLPVDAGYDVQGVVLYKSTTVPAASICGRLDTAANTFYMVRLMNDGELEMHKRIAGTFTLLGTYSAGALASEQDYTLVLELRDGEKKAYLDGTERISSSDNDITAAGRVGVRSNAGMDDATGGHLAGIVASDQGVPLNQTAIWPYNRQGPF